MESQIKVIDIYKIVIRYKKILSIGMLIVTLASLLILFLIVNPIFYSYATVKTTVKPGDISGLLGGGFSGLGDLGELAGGGAAYRELALYENILLSRRCLEETIIKFNIMEIEDIKYMNDAIKYFRKNILEIQKDKIAGTMEIGIYDKNPVRAKEIAEFLVNQLNKINTELNVQNAKNNREFLEKRYNLAKEDLRKVEDNLKEFQDIHGVAPDIQVKAVAQTEIELEASIKSEEIKLELLRKMLSDEEPEVIQQKNKIELLKKQLNNIRSSDDRTNRLSLKGAPGVVIDYLRLVRNVEIQNKILTFILPLYEQSKVEENKVMPSVLILDSPFIPDKKAKPPRLIIFIVVIFISFSLMVLALIMYEKWKYYKISGALDLNT